MPTIKNLLLTIKKGQSSSVVTVTYSVCFTKCEALAGFTYRERVELWGADGFLDSDDYLKTIATSDCFKAIEGCKERKYETTVSNKVLDEDPRFLFWKNMDEIYAKVVVNPVIASGTSLTSNTVYAYFE